MSNDHRAPVDPLDELADVVYERDLDGRMLRVNAAAERLFGCRREEILGRTLHQARDGALPDSMVVHDDAWRSLQATNARLLAEGRDRSTVTLRDPEGREHVFEAVTTLLTDEQGRPRGARGVMRDVTEQVALSRALEAQAEELRASNASLREAEQARAQLLAMLVHDLRTPLTVMAGTLELLASREGVEPLLDAARRSAEDMAHLIDDILDLHRPAESLVLQRERSPVVAFVAPPVEQAAVLAQRRSITVALDARPGLPPVDVDVARMRRVVRNLLSNALKFAPAGSTVRVDAAERGRFLELAVRDQGPGLSADEIARLFQPYVQTDAGRRHGGSGLGLAIVRRLVHAHGGEVRVEDTPGGGASFVVSLSIA